MRRWLFDLNKIVKSYRDFWHDSILIIFDSQINLDFSFLEQQMLKSFDY